MSNRSEVDKVSVRDVGRARRVRPWRKNKSSRRKLTRKKQVESEEANARMKVVMSSHREDDKVRARDVLKWKYCIKLWVSWYCTYTACSATENTPRMLQMTVGRFYTIQSDQNARIHGGRLECGSSAFSSYYVGVLWEELERYRPSKWMDAFPRTFYSHG